MGAPRKKKGEKKRKPIPHATTKGKKYRKRVLTQQQKEFILHYMANGHNATRAAIDAGFSPRSADIIGWQLVHQTIPVMEELKRIAEVAAKRSEISAGYILGSLKGIADACRVKKTELQADGTVVEKGGVADSAGANRALELLGKNQRLFIDSMEIARKTEFGDISDEELLKIIKNTKDNNI